MSMSVIALVILVIYSIALSYITLYCLMQFNLLYHYMRANKAAPEIGKGVPVVKKSRSRRKLALAIADADQSFFQSEDDEAAGEASSDYPFVTVQLPIFNEKYVVERLIDNIVRFDYPKDRFEIHLLDDSTDETLDIVRRCVARYKAQGFQIEQVLRKDREGFKGGALRDGMVLARGEFIAIFDADFLPHPDFLKRTLPFFENEEVGVVQTRWEHLNEDYSLLTRLQALQLNVHFTVEQKGRMAGDFLLQFNGTAGVWRREAIEDAGGWSADTLTEDLDLSIRAQLKGWKIRYLEEVGSPAELPVEMNSLKSQQFRWMKGGAETARKMLPVVWRSELGLWKKVQATFHLLASTVFLFVFLIGLVSVPLLFSMNTLIETGFDKDVFVYFLIGLLSIMAVYFTSNVLAPIRDESRLRSILKFIVRFPLFLSLSMALSLHNSIAVVQGWSGRKSPFVRTPKFNIRTLSDSFVKNNYRSRKLSWTTILEGFLAFYYMVAVVAGIFLGNYMFIIFHLMLAFGFGAIFILAVQHLRMTG